LPYGGDAWAMTIVMPPVGSIEALVDTLTPAGWNALVGRLGAESSEQMVHLPKFRTEVTRELPAALRTLGMGSALCPSIADFSAMFALGGRTCISQVVQKTFVDVNEEGTEAAAATAVEIIRTSLPPTLRVDRPFLFAIRERLSGTLLFVGKIVRPVAP
jgi:serine protease inhibitor